MQTAGFTRVRVFLQALRMLLIVQLSKNESYLLLRGLIPLSPSSLHLELGSSSWFSNQSLGRQGSSSTRRVMWVQEEPRECHVQGQSAVKSSHPQHRIVPPEMASDLFQCNFPLAKSPGEVSHLLPIPAAGWRVLTAAAASRVKSRFQVWCSWRALVVQEDFGDVIYDRHFSLHVHTFFSFLNLLVKAFQNNQQRMQSWYLITQAPWRHIHPDIYQDRGRKWFSLLECGCWCSTARRSQHIWKIFKGWWVIQCWLFQLCGKLQTQQLCHICET